MQKQENKEVGANRLTTFFNLLYEDLADFEQTPSVERQKERAKKKAKYNRSDLEAAALDKFRAINRKVGLFNTVDLSSSTALRDMRDFITHVLEGYVRSVDPTTIQECCPKSFVLDRWRFGPGSSIGVNGTGTVEKIDQAMTCTRSAEPLVRLLRKTNPYFEAKDASLKDGGVTCVEGSRISAVPKNDESVRIIATEPSGNMALQLSVGRLIESALRRIGLDIRFQSEKNNRLARQFSITGCGATIDLSSASDMFSINLIRNTWPDDIFSMFMALRSPVTTLPHGEVITLEMMSTMGNGFTFPMMTLTIVAIVYASRRRRGGPYRYVNFDQTGVFGDDIAIPLDDFDDVCELLSDCGLVINFDKSFSSGPFRESCGGDYYAGANITPVYVKSLSRPSGVYVAINQLLRWAAREGKTPWRALHYLRSLLGRRVFVVPQWMSDENGIRTECLSSHYKYLKQVPIERPYDGSFAYPLIAGGYIMRQDKGGRFFYNPRTDWVKEKVRSSRLPRGYLDGWDPRYADSKTSAQIQLMVGLII